MGKFNLAGQRIVNRLNNWNVVGELVPNPESDLITYAYRGDIEMWTKKVEGELMVRVAVPSNTPDRLKIEFKRPDELVSKDIVLFRIREQVAMSSKATHHAVHHDRTTKESVYAIIGVSGAKKKGKYFMYTPVFIKDADNRDQMWLDSGTPKPVAVDSRGKGVDHNFSQDWGGYVKGFFAYFQEKFALIDNVVKYEQMATRE